MKHLSPILLVLILFLAACGGPGVGGDPDFAGGPLPEGSIVEINLGGTPYPSGNPNVQVGLLQGPMGVLNIMVVATGTPDGNCTLLMSVAEDISPGTYPSGTSDGFLSGLVACTERADPVDSGGVGTLTLEQADGRYMRGSFDLSQAFEDGSQPLTAAGRFVVPYPAN